MDNVSTQNKSLSFVLGILLMILGLFALGSQIFLTYVSIVFLGWILIIGGIFEFIYGFFSGSIGGFFLSFVGGILSFFIGAIIAANPAISAATITFLIATIFVVSGSYKIITSIFVREESWVWSLVGGILIFLFGFMVLARLPESSLRIIGLFIGLQILINGLLLTMRAFQSSGEVEMHGVPYVSGAKGGKAEHKSSNKQRNNSRHS